MVVKEYCLEQDGTIFSYTERVSCICQREEWLNADIKPWEPVFVKHSLIARIG